MPEKFLLCENCHQVIARFDTEDIRKPVGSTMFKAKFPAEREVRTPWPDPAEAAFMKCPMCPRRVFNLPDPQELYIADRIDGIDAYRWPIPEPQVCPTCGRPKESFKTVPGFINHIRFCAARTAAADPDPAEE